MPTISEQLIERLVSHGVNDVFGLPGDYVIKFFSKLYKSKINVISTTSEASAGMAADAYARVNGLGCCCVTYCVGGFNLINAIAGAYAEKSPVIVISGSPGLKERQEKVLLHHMVGHFECQHKIFEHITCANTVLRDADRAGYEIDRVLTAAHQYKQPVYIELPRDMIDQPIRYDVYSQGTPREQLTDSESLAESVAEVTHWINNSRNPVIWAGVEVARFGLGKALMKFAEQTNIPIATTVLGKSVVNESHPLSLGVYCENTASDELNRFMDNSDCIIMLGVMMADVNLGFLPRRTQKRQAVIATSKTLQVSNHTYQDVRFVDFVNALVKAKVEKREPPRITAKPKAIFLVQKETKLKTSRFFEKINSILDPNMAIVSDVGDALFGALDITVHEAHHFLCDAFYASMGFAVPAALGIQTAKPNIRPIVIVGDGAFQMTGMEFSTIVRRHLTGHKSNPIIFVLNNQGYGTERLILDGPYNNVQNWSYDKVPVLVGGGSGYRVETEEQLDSVVTKALSVDEPAIVNVILDPKDHSPTLKRIFGKVQH